MLSQLFSQSQSPLTSASMPLAGNCPCSTDLALSDLRHAVPSCLLTGQVPFLKCSNDQTKMFNIASLVWYWKWNLDWMTVKGTLKSLCNLLPGKLIVRKSKPSFLIVPCIGTPSPWNPIGTRPSAGQLSVPNTPMQILDKAAWTLEPLAGCASSTAFGSAMYWANHSWGRQKGCHLSSTWSVFKFFMGTFAQYNLGQAVFGYALNMHLAALAFPFLALNFFPWAPALLAFSMFLFATVAGKTFLACKFMLKVFQSSDWELSLFLLEEELLPAWAFCRPTWNNVQSQIQHKSFMVFLSKQWLQTCTPKKNITKNQEKQLETEAAKAAPFFHHAAAICKAQACSKVAQTKALFRPLP